MKNCILIMMLLALCSCASNKALKKTKSTIWSPTSLAQMSGNQFINAGPRF